MILQDFAFFGTKKGADPYKCRRIDKEEETKGRDETEACGLMIGHLESFRFIETDCKVGGRRNEMKPGCPMFGSFESFRLYDHGREIECTDDRKPTIGGPITEKAI